MSIHKVHNYIFIKNYVVGMKVLLMSTNNVHVASDLGLRCLPMSHIWDSRHKWVNSNIGMNFISMDCIDV